jgi:hypothetical protein
MTLNQKKVKAHQKGQHPPTLEGRAPVPPKKNAFIGARPTPPVVPRGAKQAQSMAFGNMVADTDKDGE